MPQSTSGEMDLWGVKVIVRTLTKREQRELTAYEEDDDEFNARLFHKRLVVPKVTLEQARRLIKQRDVDLLRVLRAKAMER